MTDPDFDRQLLDELVDRCGKLCDRLGFVPHEFQTMFWFGTIRTQVPPESTAEQILALQRIQREAVEDPEGYIARCREGED